MSENTKGASAPQVVADERAAFESDTLETCAAATFGRFPASGRYNVDWIENQWAGWQRRAALAAPAAQGDAKDAERWRGVLMHVGATVTGDIDARFTLRFLEPIEGTDLMRGGVAGHFTDAIDAAIAAKAAS